MGLVRLISVVVMAIDDIRSFACHGRRPAAHHLFNFGKCAVDIIISGGLWGKGNNVGSSVKVRGQDRSCAVVEWRRHHGNRRQRQLGRRVNSW